MAIINMGQLNEPHESSASEALRTFKTMATIGTGMSNAATAAKNAESLAGYRETAGAAATSNAATSAKNAVTRQGELDQALATSEIRKAEMNIKNVKATHARYSLMWNDMDAQQKKIFQTSDQYKELQKFFKGFKGIAPGILDDQGNIVASSSKDVYADKLSERTAQAKMNIAANKGTQEDINLVRMDKLGGSEKMAKSLTALEKAIKAKKVDKSDPNAVEDFMRNWWRDVQSMQRAFKRHSEAKRRAAGLDQPATMSEALAPERAQRPDPTEDPLGAFIK